MNLGTLRDDVSSISTLEQMAVPLAQYALEMTTRQKAREDARLAEARAHESLANVFGRALDFVKAQETRPMPRCFVHSTALPKRDGETRCAETGEAPHFRRSLPRVPAAIWGQLRLEEKQLFIQRGKSKGVD